jgi:hypothetical protein
MALFHFSHFLFLHTRDIPLSLSVPSSCMRARCLYSSRRVSNTCHRLLSNVDCVCVVCAHEAGGGIKICDHDMRLLRGYLAADRNCDDILLKSGRKFTAKLTKNIHRQTKILVKIARVVINCAIDSRQIWLAKLL